MESSSSRLLKFTKIFLIIFLVIVFASSLFLYQYYQAAKLPIDINNKDEIIVDIPNGSSTSKIASILKINDLIKSEFYFKFAAKQKGIGEEFKAGKYILNKAMTPDEIMNKIVRGETFVDTIKFTIPEGFELRQIIEKLSNIELNLDKERLIYLIENEDFNYEFLKEIPKGTNRLEGFLFPDTYIVKKDITEKEILELMLNRFDDVFKDEYYTRAMELGMSIKEVVTLASIIEREAMVSEERPIISSVFHNRLKNNMLLQSCATVQYILGERKKVLTYDDLEIESPYNTYKYTGLPPRPIASPGKSSIEAALFPDETDYLYFVAKGDGSHAFSKTYSEHLRAKREYQ